MPIKIVSDRPAVVASIVAAMAHDPARSVRDAARVALIERYGLAPGDGIYGCSEAALCLGYSDRDEDENFMDEIVHDLASGWPYAVQPAGEDGTRSARPAT